MMSMASSMTSSMAEASMIASAVATNVKSTVTIDAAKLANANYPGPFTAGVNQVIPFEAFGGDGMLTRLLLNSSVGAPWSDNGTAMNPALLPINGLAAGKYFYEVDLAGTNGLTGADLLNYLKMQGTRSYQATVKVYAANPNGTANMNLIVGMKTITIDFTGMTMTEENSMNDNDQNLSQNEMSQLDSKPMSMMNKSMSKNSAKMLPETGETNSITPILVGIIALITGLFIPFATFLKKAASKSNKNF